MNQFVIRNTHFKKISKKRIPKLNLTYRNNDPNMRQSPTVKCYSNLISGKEIEIPVFANFSQTQSQYIDNLILFKRDFNFVEGSSFYY